RSGHRGCDAGGHALEKNLPAGPPDLRGTHGWAVLLMCRSGAAARIRQPRLGPAAATAHLSRRQLQAHASFCAGDGRDIRRRGNRTPAARLRFPAVLLEQLRIVDRARGSARPEASCFAAALQNRYLEIVDHSGSCLQAWRIAAGGDRVPWISAHRPLFPEPERRVSAGSPGDLVAGRGGIQSLLVSLLGLPE